MTCAKARIIARLIGDGSIYPDKYTIKYEVKDLESLSSFSMDFMETYGLDVKRGHNLSGITGKPIPFVRVRSKRAYQDLMFYGSYNSHNWKVPDAIIEANVEAKREFLRALFDDEGTVHSKKRIVRLYSINLLGIMQIQSIIQKLGLGSKIYGGFGCKRNVYGLVISGKENLKRFANVIGFGLKRKSDKLLEALRPAPKFGKIDNLGVQKRG